jgi:hypothetical protein
VSREQRGTGPRALLTPAVLVAVAVAVVCAVVALVVEGPSSLGAVALGSALVLGFLLVGQLPVSLAAKGRGGLGAMLLLLGYTTRVALLLLAFRMVLRSGSPDREVLGLTVVAVGLGWTAGTVFSFLRWRPAVVDVELPSAGGSGADVPADEGTSAR